MHAGGLLELIVLLLLVLLALAGVFGLSWALMWLAVRRWRLVATAPTVRGTDSVPPAAAALLDEVERWALAHGFVREDDFEQSAPVAGGPPAFGRCWRDAGNRTRLAVVIPPAPLHRLRWLAACVSFRGDGSWFETVAGYDDFRVLAVTPATDVGESPALDLAAQCAAHAARVAREDVVPLPDRDEQYARTAAAWEAAVAAALREARLARRADGSLQLGRRAAWSVVRRQMRGVRRLRRLRAGSWFARRRAARPDDSPSADGPLPRRQLAATLLFAVIVGGIIGAALAWSGVTAALRQVVYRLDPVAAAQLAEWPADVPGWEQRIRAAPSPDDAAQQAINALDVYAADENWPAVRRLLATARPALAHPALEADARVRFLSTPVTLIARSPDPALRRAAAALFEDALATCRAQLAADPGCAAVPLVARAAGHRWRDDDAAARADYVAALARAEQAPQRHGEELVSAAAGLAELAVADGQLAGAESLLRQVIAHAGNGDPRAIEAYVGLAGVQHALRRPADAAATLAAMAAVPWDAWLAPDAQRAAYTELAWWALAADDARGALAALDRGPRDLQDPEWLAVRWLAAVRLPDAARAAEARAALLALQAQATESWGRQLMAMPRQVPQYAVGLYHDDDGRRRAALHAALVAEAARVRPADPARADALLALLDLPASDCRPPD